MSQTGKPFIFANHQPHEPSCPYCQGGSSCASAASARGKQGWTMGWRCSHSQRPWAQCGMGIESSAGRSGDRGHLCFQCSGMGGLQSCHQSKICLHQLEMGTACSGLQSSVWFSDHIPHFSPHQVSSVLASYIMKTDLHIQTNGPRREYSG